MLVAMRSREIQIHKLYGRRRGWDELVTWRIMEVGRTCDPVTCTGNHGRGKRGQERSE